MSRAVFPLLLPIGVLLVMAVIILLIAQVYFLSGHTGAVIAGIVMTALVGIVASIFDRRPRPS